MGWLKVKAASRYSGISERTMRSWLKQGLPHSKMPSGMVLIKEQDIDCYLGNFQIEDNAPEKIANSLIEELAK